MSKLKCVSSQSLLHSPLAYAAIFVHTPKNCCWALSANLQRWESQGGTSCLISQDSSLATSAQGPARQCRPAQTLVLREAATRPRHIVCTQRWAGRSQEWSTLPPAIAKSSSWVPCPGPYHPRSIRDAAAHPLLPNTSGCVAASFIPVLPPHPRSGTAQGNADRIIKSRTIYYKKAIR